MGVVIVAIPSEQDPVWKYSSEKIPHMTILFLGDIQDQGPDLAAIESFMQHIADTSLPRFGMSVDRRGTLGPDDADVLFFDLKRYDRNIKIARDNMLQEPHIRAAFDTADQFPEWTPHLTMGYPATPAKPDDRDYPGFNWVNFDRIALWVGDFEGPTIQLKDQYEEYESAPLDMAHDSLSEEYGGVKLEHSGVKGMKWGVHHEKRLQLLNKVADGTATKGEKAHVALTQVSSDSVRKSGSLQAAAKNKAAELQGRKDRIQKGEGTFKDRIALAGGDRLHENSGAKAKKVAKADAKFESTKHIHNTLEFGSGKVDRKVQREAFKKLNDVDIPRIRKDPKYKVIDKKQYNARQHYKDPKKYKDLTENHAAVLKQFDKEVEKAWQKNIHDSVSKLGTNASGTKEYKVTTGKDWFYIEPVAIKHDDAPSALKFAVIRDSDGFIVSISDTPEVDMVKHEYGGVVLDDDYLAHHGVKGMKWGVRKEEDSGGGSGSGAGDKIKKQIADRTGTEVVVKTTPGKQIVTVGGNKREASADAIRARTAQQVAEKSTLDALSNKDLQDLVTRMNLEQQYNRLAFNEGDSRQSEGQQFVNRTLNQYGDTAVKTLATNPTTAPYAIPVALAIKTYQHSGANKSYKRSQRPGVQQPKKEDMPGKPERPKFEDIVSQVGEYNK